VITGKIQDKCLSTGEWETLGSTENLLFIAMQYRKCLICANLMMEGGCLLYGKAKIKENCLLMGVFLKNYFTYQCM
jgi:hypothetical protein